MICSSGLFVSLRSFPTTLSLAAARPVGSRLSSYFNANPFFASYGVEPIDKSLRERNIVPVSKEGTARCFTDQELFQMAKDAMPLKNYKPFWAYNMSCCYEGKLHLRYIKNAEELLPQLPQAIREFGTLNLQAICFEVPHLKVAVNTLLREKDNPLDYEHISIYNYNLLKNPQIHVIYCKGLSPEAIRERIPENFEGCCFDNPPKEEWFNELIENVGARNPENIFRLQVKTAES